MDLVVRALGDFETFLGLRGGYWYNWWSALGPPAIFVVWWQGTCDIPGCFHLGWHRMRFTGKSFCGIHARLGQIENDKAVKDAEHGELPSEAQ